MAKFRPVTEIDLRMPEFRDPDLKLEELEFRSSDGKIVRKDRWETGFRSIATALGFNAREGFEIPDVVKKARDDIEMHCAQNKAGWVIKFPDGGFLLETGDSFEHVELEKADIYEHKSDAEDMFKYHPKPLKEAILVYVNSVTELREVAEPEQQEPRHE